MPLGHGDFVAGAALWIAACKRALTINAIAYSSVASNQIERNVGFLSGATSPAKLHPHVASAALLIAPIDCIPPS